jgi:hypothetical protein
LTCGTHDDFLVRVGLYPGKITNQYYPDEKSATISSLTVRDLRGRMPSLDVGSGSPYKLPQRNDAKDGPVRNFIAQALVIVGVRTAGHG